jgi:hypothetical protein
VLRWSCGSSAHDALAVIRQRCWPFNWVLEYDILALFDEIDHSLLLKPLHYHCNERFLGFTIVGETIAIAHQAFLLRGYLAPSLAHSTRCSLSLGRRG